MRSAWPNALKAISITYLPKAQAAIPEARPAKKPASKPAKDPGALIMKHSYQRFGTVARGTEIAGGGRQTVVTFPKAMFAKVGAAAKAKGISFSEQVRRYVQEAVGA